MITIGISENIELVIVDDGGMCIKDKFTGKSISILPEELDDMIEALEKAKMQRVANKFISIAKSVDVKICTCSEYQRQQYGCVCQKNLR